MQIYFILDRKYNRLPRALQVYKCIYLTERPTYQPHEFENI